MDLNLLKWKPNWQLRKCCNHDQVIFLISVAVCTVVILVLWRTVLMTPFKLITVFLHEVSHAIACLLTCGKVEGIKVNADEGGVTQTRGGISWLILPAGCNPFPVLDHIYFSVGLHIASDLVVTLIIFRFCVTPDLGSSFWGMVLILASTKHLTTQIAAGCFVVALIIVFFLAKNWTLRGLCIGFIVLFAGIWYLQEATPVHMLREVILFTGNCKFVIFVQLLLKKVAYTCGFPMLTRFCQSAGVMNSLFSVYDIYDDLISRRINTSDAERFADECPCCTGCGWGVIWAFISFTFLCGSVYLALVILSPRV
ncbi:uncharacterized protein LOC103950639 isoform X1 [Pyrus x bretschneideri]|uniref:uncharacterized protein LOC103950639 isoform X1 n=1 Tax=Pyrus x bretschneideri TaxID=225117 RepID=UPI00202F84A2|nr:uncharacterized protein LOC103950639 isoform X1 [Pyrus x bretschneideri]